ncbi:MAG: hypothetical protein GXP10_11055 [Gammaproteobacteria bacterium]|nr:hypothetical protein [Gammaproteobacteria bacterium]
MINAITPTLLPDTRSRQAAPAATNATQKSAAIAAIELTKGPDRQKTRHYAATEYTVEGELLTKKRPAADRQESIFSTSHAAQNHFNHHSNTQTTAATSRLALASYLDNAGMQGSGSIDTARGNNVNYFA